MRCPKCGSTLRERERRSVVVDVCPRCGGVWLDAGELEKLSSSGNTFYEHGRDDDDDWGADADDRQGPGRGKRRRGGFLQNLFDGLGD